MVRIPFKNFVLQNSVDFTELFRKNSIAVFSKWSGTFIEFTEFRELDKSATCVLMELRKHDAGPLHKLPFEIRLQFLI